MLNDAFEVSETSEIKNWKDVYVAALLEGDPDRVPMLILEAECAIRERARVLFIAAGENINIQDEEKALNEALYALYALKSCLAVHGRFAEAAGEAGDAENHDS